MIMRHHDFFSTHRWDFSADTTPPKSYSCTPSRGFLSSVSGSWYGQLSRPLVIVIVFLFFLVISGFYAHSFPSFSPSSSLSSSFAPSLASVDAQVFSALQHDTSVPVIIELDKSAGIPLASFSSPQEKQAALQQNKLIIASLQDTLVEDISSDDVQIQRRFTTLFGLSARVTKNGLKQLQRHPLVKAIHYDRENQIFLTESLGIIGANNVQGTILHGNNITGSGETVCIIDTGVDYTHESLGNCTSSQFTAGNCSKVITGYDFVNSDNNPLDDHGHGTHVAGIVAANGTVTGVAPGARIAAIKSCNSGGACLNSWIISGIDACMDNKAAYNISVMSMSLGGGKFSAVCDSDPLASAANEAVALGIYVVAASGNDGNKTHLSSPACASNVTSVGATYDADLGSKTYPTAGCTDTTTAVDKVACFSNSNALLDLMAPGAIITSTARNGGTTSMTGTSQATPHVAGGAALLLQYRRLQTGGNLTPSQLQTILNTTGLVVADTGNNLTFSRINLSAALASLVLPITLEYPLNNSNLSDTTTWSWVNISTNVSTTCKYSQENRSFNFTSQGTLFNITGSTLHSFNLTNLSEGNSYTLYYKCNISAQTEDYVAATHVFHIPDQAPSITLVYPANATNLSIDTLWTWINLTTHEQAECHYHQTNVSFAFSNGTSFTLTNSTAHAFNFSNNSVLQEGANYTLFYKCKDLRNNTNAESITHVFGVDQDLAPRVTLVSPQNNSYSTTNNVSFTCSATDDKQLTNITFYWNYTGNFTANETITVNGTQNTSSFQRTSLNDTAILWNCLAYDNRSTAQYNSSSVNYTVTIDTLLPNVTSVIPQNASVNVTERTNITLTFSESVLNTTVTNQTFTITYPSNASNNTQVEGSFQFLNNSRIVIFSPYLFLPENKTFTVQVYDTITDVAGNRLIANHSSIFTTRFKDTDEDSIPDYLDDDDDNDGIVDANDTLKGNSSSINTPLDNVTILVNESANLSVLFAETNTVELRKESRPLVQFSYNFTIQNVLDLTALKIEERQSGNNFTSLLIYGLNLSGTTKKFFLQNLTPNATGICIKDLAITSLDQLNTNGNCTGTSEIKVQCDGTEQNNYTCTYNTTASRFLVEPLQHSGIEQINYSCTSSWSCNSWGSCSNNLQTCNEWADSNSCGRDYTGSLTQSCSSGGGSSGGGGGGGGGSQLSSKNEVSHSWASVIQGKTYSFNVTSNNIALTQIAFVPAKNLSDVTITAKSLNSLPDTVPVFSLVPYQYLNISTQHLHNQNISNVTFIFVVNQTFLAVNNVTTQQVILLRDHTGVWEELPTTVVKKNQTVVTYTASSLGFSYFVIALKPILRELVNETPENLELPDLEENVTTNISDSLGDDNQTSAIPLAVRNESAQAISQKGPTFYTYFLAFVVFVFVLLIGFAYLHVKEHAALIREAEKQKKEGKEEKKESMSKYNRGQ